MEQEEKKKDRRVVIPLLILVVGFGVILFFVTRNLSEEEEAPKKEVKEETFVLKEESLSEELEFSGNLEANRESQLSSKISGRIASFKVKEGDLVRKGQLLVTIFPDQNGINLQNRSLEFLNFEEFRRNQERFLNRQVEIAEEDLDIAKEERDYVEENDLGRLDIAEDEVDKAEEELRAAKRDRDAQKDSLKQQSDNLSGERNLAAQDVVDTRIRAPFNGVVTRKFSEEGEVVNVSVGGLLLSVADVSSYKVVIEVSDTLIERLSNGLEARVILDGISGEHRAVVTLVNPEADEASKKIEVEVTLDSIPQNAKIDMFARVFIKFPPRKIFSVPSNFIFAGFSGPFVVLEDGTKKNVERGNEMNGKTEISFKGMAGGIILKRNFNGRGE